jgi:glutamate-1-semialdehyde aminotransferase
VIPEGSQTKSKRPDQFARGTSPVFLERGRGAHVWDVDGNRYLDYPMALGPGLLGYAEPVVDDAIRRQLASGITFTLPHPLEVEVAERIVALCPGVEAVRFVKTGSDAVSAAVRAARALTGRDRVLVAGYHGWHDWYVGTTSRGAGVPAAVAALTSTVPFDDLPALEAALAEGDGQIAAVVVEPSGATVPSPGYLEAAVQRARAAGALAVFDEVISGFRLAPGGARERYGVHPDLSCYGKALGNGMPIAAVAGAWPAMRAFEDVFVSGTHGGEALSLAAARAVLDTIADGRVLADIEARGLRLAEALTKLVASYGLGDRVSMGGEPQRSVVTFVGPAPLADRTWVTQSLAAAGILFNGSLFISARHTDADIDTTVEAFEHALAVLSDHEDVTPLLTGPVIEPVF